jgi:hypothetical protein
VRQVVWVHHLEKMGRPAHTEGNRRPDNRSHAAVNTVADPMLQQIRELLSADAPNLDTLESTLTEGYAQALALEAERWRLERRLGEVARAGGPEMSDEISSLGRRLTVADDELVKLRSLLGSLHERARALRVAS